MNEPTPNCPACEAPTNPLAKHKLDCANITLADALWHANYLKIGESYYHRVYQQQIASAQRWEGKFRVVKHENNQLRRKMGARYPATPSEQALWKYSCAEIDRLNGNDIHQTTP